MFIWGERLVAFKVYIVLFIALGPTLPDAHFYCTFKIFNIVESMAAALVLLGSGGKRTGFITSVYVGQRIHIDLYQVTFVKHFKLCKTK